MRRVSFLRFEFVAAAIAAQLMCSALAHAQDAGAQDAEPSPTDIKQAARAFDNARNAFGAEDFATAADEFETADGYAPSPVALQWAIDAHHRAGNAARAATLAALAKQRHPEVAELVELADRVISETRENLVEVQVVCDEPCELFVDSKIVHGQPAGTRTLYLNPGSYSVTASFGSGGKGKAEQVEGQAGDARSVLFAPPALGASGTGEDAPSDGMDDPFAEDFHGTDDPTADTSAKGESGGWSPAVFWVSASLTAVSGAVTIWSGLDTQKNPGTDAVKEKCKGLGESCPEYQEGLQNQKRTNILLGVTGGLAVFTVVSAILTDWSGAPAKADNRSPKHSDTAWAVEPWVSVGQHNAVGAMGRF